MACRMAWGTIQEAASLHHLGLIFPNSLIEEVGGGGQGPLLEASRQQFVAATRGAATLFDLLHK